MRATVGVAAAGLAASASAFLIPSTDSAPEFNALPIHVEDEADSNGLNAFTLVDPTSQILTVDCAGCLFAQRESADKPIVWTQGVENALVLNISVGAEPETLELNGARLYPPVLGLTAEAPVPYIPQIPADMDMVSVRNSAEELQKNALRLTSWAWQSGPSQTVSETGDELITIHLQLNALEQQSINVPDVAITALKNAEGELMIVRVETQDKEEVLKQECEQWPLLCKMRDLISDKVEGLKGLRPHFVGLGGKPPCQKGRPDGEHGVHMPPHGGKHHHGPPGGWKHHGPPGHGRHGWQHHHMHHGKFAAALHTIGRVLIAIVIPALIGVVVGMVTYGLAALLGAFIAAIYLTIRGRNARYQAVALDEESEHFEGDDDVTPRNSGDYEKEGLLEAPPVYAEKE